MSEFVNFASGTITDSPLTVGAVQVNSAAFATVLPVIAAPHTMTLVLDPAGDDGPPEIVVVTAHAASSGQVTVTRGSQTSIGGNVARAHAAGTAWVLAATALDLNRVAGDPGDLKAGIWSSPPAGWLLMGQSISGASTTYPALWAVVPAAWKGGGGVLNLPSMDGRVLMGGPGTLGAVGGANLHTLVTANLPAHTHAIDHNHASATHSHTMNHDHAVFNSGDDVGAHQHVINVRDNSTAGTTAYVMASSSAGTVGSAITDAANDTHVHTVNVPAYTGSTSTTAVDLPVHTGASGSTGTGTAVDHTPSNLRINVAIKT